MIEHSKTTTTNKPSAEFINGRVMPIYVNGADVLRQVCKDVPTEYPELPKLLADMFATVREADGIGLAAPQVGLPVRLFVIDMTDFEADPQMPDHNPGLGRKVFINPRITEVSEEETPFKEGCLSIPGINESVSRPATITIEYQDENRTLHVDTFSGIWARAIQHEHDHLNGNLFIDSVAQIRKQMLSSKLQAMTRGKYKAHYKTKR